MKSVTLSVTTFSGSFEAVVPEEVSGVLEVSAVSLSSGLVSSGRVVCTLSVVSDEVSAAVTRSMKVKS